MNINRLIITPILAALIGISAIILASLASSHYQKKNTQLITQTVENSDLAVDTHKAFFEIKQQIENHTYQPNHDHHHGLDNFKKNQSSLHHLLPLLYLSEDIQPETKLRGDEISDNLNVLTERWLDDVFMYLSNSFEDNTLSKEQLTEQTLVIELALSELYSIINYSLLVTAAEQEKEFEKIFHIVMVIFFILFASSVLWDFYYSKKIINRLSLLISSMKKLNTGKTNHIIPFIKTSGDIGEIARATCTFQAKLIELNRRNVEIEKIANQDPLTGIANRRFLDEYFLRITDKKDTEFYLFHMDLDDFKVINDTYGHSIGDQVLISITNTIQTILGEKDFFARIGGDEFVILKFIKDPKNHINTAAEHLIKSINKPIIIHKRIINMNGSCGISHFPSDGDTLESLMRHADTALNKTKKTAKNSYLEISETLKEQAKNRNKTLKELHEAINNHQVIPFFQPQYSLKTKELVGFEALARWQHPEKGTLSPQYFIEEASATELIEKIGYAILDETINAIKTWQKLGLPATCVSINVSHRELSNPNFYDNLIRKLAKHNIDGASISIEVLETVATDNNNIFILQNLCKLHRYGINLDVDDFGVGYSSISSLQKSNFQRIKIDKSFACTNNDSDKDKTLLLSMLQLAESLKIESLVEGIETEEQLVLAKEYGCHIIQGYLIAKPMSVSNATEWWQNTIKNEYRDIFQRGTINLSEQE